VPKADNLPPSCADVKKSGGLNLLEPRGPVQACNGTALLYFIVDEAPIHPVKFAELDYGEWYTL
jgi:hypothetical protein